MISTDYTVHALVESIFSIPGLITGLAGVLVSLVMYRLRFLSKKAWLGNSCSIWTGVVCIAIIIVLLTFKLFWLLPCVLIIPCAMVGTRFRWLCRNYIKQHSRSWQISRREWLWLLVRECEARGLYRTGGQDAGIGQESNGGTRV